MRIKNTCLYRCWIIIVLLCCGQSLWAQTEDAHLKKYWDYRDRFLGEDGGSGFVRLGLEQGQSLVILGRNPIGDCRNDWHLNHSYCDIHDGTGKIEWGDAMVYQGYYIATLALEYRNLLDANADVSATSEELYYALKAVERVDSMAEIALGLEPKLDGFYIRDDVPYDFYVDEKDANNLKFKWSETEGYECVKSEFSCRETQGVDDGTFVSQDQSLALMLGFSFVHKLVPNERYKFSEESFGEMVALYTHRIVDFMQKNKWRIYGPDGTKISNRWGGDCKGFSYAFRKFAEKIVDDKYADSYKKGGSRFLGRVVKGSFSWGFGLQARRNQWLILASLLGTGDWSAKQMAKRARKADRIMYALAYSVIHDLPLHKSIKKKELFEFIETAPKDGPCFGTPNCQAPDGWKSFDRWWRTKHKNGNPYGLIFEYNGLDFMIFYNLYYYLYKDELPKYR